jgi:hypothetical protein
MPTLHRIDLAFACGRKFLVMEILNETTLPRQVPRRETRGRDSSAVTVQLLLRPRKLLQPILPLRPSDGPAKTGTIIDIRRHQKVSQNAASDEERDTDDDLATDEDQHA